MAKSVFNQTVCALVANIAFSGIAMGMDDAQKYANAIKECDVETVQDLFGPKRHLYGHAMELTKDLKKNVRMWLLFAAAEKNNFEVIWKDWLLHHALFPKGLVISSDRQARNDCPTLKEILFWYVKNDLEGLFHILDNVGPQGNAFPHVAGVLLNDAEMLKYIAENAKLNIKILYGSVLGCMYRNKSAADALGVEYKDFYEEIEQNTAEVNTSSD
jgi:hypothetical protein